MRAYSESYLHDARLSLGEMLEYVVLDCCIDPDAFMGDFVASGLARQFARGNPRYVAGMSGIELADAVSRRTRDCGLETSATQSLTRSSWYWTGWILAYYQWHCCAGFDRLMEWGLAPSAIERMYVLHEADESVFVERADAIVAAARAQRPTSLKSIRKARGLTQDGLATAAGVSLRMIQLYEQRQNNLDVASAATLVRLSRALGCSMEDLLEEPFRESYEYAVVAL